MARARTKDLLLQQEGDTPDVASKPSQGLGKWVDDLLGDKKARQRAALKAKERRAAFSQDPR